MCFGVTPSAYRSVHAAPIFRFFEPSPWHCRHRPPQAFDSAADFFKLKQKTKLPAYAFFLETFKKLNIIMKKKMLYEIADDVHWLMLRIALYAH